VRISLDSPLLQQKGRASGPARRISPSTRHSPIDVARFGLKVPLSLVRRPLYSSAVRLSEPSVCRLPRQWCGRRARGSRVLVPCARMLVGGCVQTGSLPGYKASSGEKACGLARDASLQPVSYPHIPPTITSKGKHDLEEDEESGDDCEDSAPSRLVWFCKDPGDACEHQHAANRCKDPSQCRILSLGPHHDLDRAERATARRRNRAQRERPCTRCRLQLAPRPTVRQYFVRARATLPRWGSRVRIPSSVRRRARSGPRFMPR
jgi:hypothetical protein